MLASHTAPPTISQQSLALKIILEARESLGVSASEVYTPALVPREAPLWRDSSTLNTVINQLKERESRQLHCAYFGNPTAFFSGGDSPSFQALVRNMGGEAEVQKYYGDLTGAHLLERVCQEYELALRSGLDHYTVHFGIDYSFSDGMYEYGETYGLDRHAVLDAALRQTERYLKCIHAHLRRNNLFTPGGSLPTIGIENAGWGLEYGMQTAQDFLKLLAHLEHQQCPLRHLVKIDWDVNHLLHALGKDPSSGRGRFFVSNDEYTETLRTLEERYGDAPSTLAAQWIGENLLNPELLPHVRCVHLSDCSWKSEAYFLKCQAVGEHLRALLRERSPEARALLGERMVLQYYDSHLYLGSSDGMVRREEFVPVIQALAKERERRADSANDLIILHELKNNPYVPQNGELSQHDALARQVAFLRECGVFFDDARVEVRF